MSLIECPDCAGIGKAVARRSRRTVTFDLNKPCETCAGTGKALVKRRVIYDGRPDLRSRKEKA